MRQKIWGMPPYNYVERCRAAARLASLKATIDLLK
jgi:hypothetical protein